MQLGHGSGGRLMVSMIERCPAPEAARRPTGRKSPGGRGGDVLGDLPSLRRLQLSRALARPWDTPRPLQSPDAPWIIVVLVALGVAAALHLAWRYRNASTVALLVVSLAAVAVGVLEGSNSAARLVPASWGGPAALRVIIGITMTPPVQAGCHLEVGRTCR